MINPLARVPALIARAAHQVITEYRKLDGPAAEPGGEHDCVQARAEHSWQQVGPSSRPVMGFASAGLVEQFDDPSLTGTDRGNG